MPNRLIKESFRTSDRINSLTDFQFRLWVSLITYVDDYGRGDARLSVIKGHCFPLRERITIKDIDAALQELAGAGCVGLYEVDGKPYLYFPRWESHQQIRSKKSKYPSPDEGLSTTDVYRNNLISDDINCNQVISNAPVIQSNPNPNPNPKSAEREADFNAFWSAYPRKDNKSEAKKAFGKVKVSVDVLIKAIEQYKKTPQWMKNGGQFIPYPSTWLNQKRWEDEIGTSTTEEVDIYAGLL